MQAKKAEDRFWRKVTFYQNGSCWEWTGYKSKNGYGRFHYMGRAWLAHRFAFQIKNILYDDKVVDHKCRNRSCVNPDHLRMVTRAINNTENSLSPPAINKLKAWCSKGHEFTQENTKIRTDSGGRICVTCKRAGELVSSKKYYHARIKNKTSTKATDI